MIDWFGLSIACGIILTMGLLPTLSSHQRYKFLKSWIDEDIKKLEKILGDIHYKIDKLYEYQDDQKDHAERLQQYYEENKSTIKTLRNDISHLLCAMPMKWNLRYTYEDKIHNAIDSIDKILYICDQPHASKYPLAIWKEYGDKIQKHAKIVFRLAPPVIIK